MFDLQEPAGADHDCRRTRLRNVTFPAQEFEPIGARTVAFDFAASTPNEIRNIVLASGETVSACLDSIAAFRPDTLSVRHIARTHRLRQQVAARVASTPVTGTTLQDTSHNSPRVNVIALASTRAPTTVPHCPTAGQSAMAPELAEDERPATTSGSTPVPTA